ncbi:MAG: PglZ domain-containing protein [Bacteroidota bacterium]
MKNADVLWVDDEIELLKPHILFLEDKGYNLITATNGDDAIKIVNSHSVDLIILDEMMPGMTGLETLNVIKSLKPSVPVIMITKSEEEDIMDQAIGSKIADYLIKPVKPNQILLSIKKNLDTKRLVNQKTTTAYQSQFSQIGIEINSANSFNEWTEIYKKLVFWELELDRTGDAGISEVLNLQKNEANAGFSKFIRKNYKSWFSGNNESKPLMSPNLFSKKIYPIMDDHEKVAVILIDNLRFDQWHVIKPLVSESFNITAEELYCSILPTATQYSRNSIFAGLMPLEIGQLYPDLWINDEEEESKNQYEEELLKGQLQRSGKNTRFYYEKVSNLKTGKKILNRVNDLTNYPLSVIVYNFVDILSHARTEMELIKELANDEAAYRSLTLSWFEHSHLLDIIRELSARKFKVVITTDHGTVRVFNPLRVVGDRKTSTNLRYKTGRNLNYNPKEVFEIQNPSDIHLPTINLSSSYIFAMHHDFLVYPNNYNYYSNYFRNTFQHGGISMEEMLIPVVVLSPK